MTESDITQYIMDTFEGVDIVTANGDSFFFHNPAGVPPDHRFPFATLVTSDFNDSASDLEREGVFRLNIGAQSETYRAMFGPQPAFPKDDGVVGTGHDFTSLDRIMPHPVYASMSWVCVLNPSERTFEAVKPLLEEAYRIAASQTAKRAARQENA